MAGSIQDEKERVLTRLGRGTWLGASRAGVGSDGDSPAELHTWAPAGIGGRRCVTGLVSQVAGVAGRHWVGGGLFSCSPTLSSCSSPRTEYESPSQSPSCCLPGPSLPGAGGGRGTGVNCWTRAKGLAGRWGSAGGGKASSGRGTGLHTSGSPPAPPWPSTDIVRPLKPYRCFTGVPLSLQAAQEAG